MGNIKEKSTQTSRKQVKNGTPKFKYIKLYIKCEKSEHSKCKIDLSKKQDSVICYL